MAPNPLKYENARQTGKQRCHYNSKFGRRKLLYTRKSQRGNEQGHRKAYASQYPCSGKMTQTKTGWKPYKARTHQRIHTEEYSQRLTKAQTEKNAKPNGRQNQVEAAHIQRDARIT